MTKKQLKQEIKNITRQIIEKYRPERVILFGSAVRGNFDEHSDLDFLIIKRGTPRISPLANLRKSVTFSLIFM